MRVATSLRHSGAMRSIEPGISTFRVWSFGPSRNDSAANAQFAPRAIQWQNYSQAKTKAAGRKLRGRKHVHFTGGARRRRTIRGPRRAMAAADAQRGSPQPSVPDLGAVRGAGPELVLRRISR